MSKVISGRGITGLAIAAILTAATVIAVPNLIENLDAGEIMVIQSVTGDLKVYTEPGPKWQGFGKVTTYPRQAQYSFCSQLTAAGTEVQCADADSPGKRVRFSEGGHAVLSGAVNWVMPTDEASIIKIHKKFNNAKAVEQMAVAKMLDNAIYLTGPLMTSTESSGARRSELVQYIDDQAEHGVYVTKSTQVVQKDATGANQTVTLTEIVNGKDGQPMRQQGSVLDEFHISLLPIAINELKYDRVVEQQIADRQKSTTDVQLSIATAVKAEQAAKTVEAEGKAAAAKAKWEQETIKAKAVTEAQQKYEVAALEAKAAEQYKRKQILEGEGNATKMRLEMQANGALEQKLAAYKDVNQMYADALAKHQGPLVPTTVIGAGTGGTNSVQNLMNMLQVKTAHDLSLDMGMKK